VAAEDYLSKGYLPETLINFVALLGWNPGEGNTQEIFTLDELVELFDLSGVNKAGAVFDLKKLDWMNAEYIKRLSVDELYERAKSFFGKQYEEDFMKKVLIIEQERLTKLSDVGVENPFFFADPTVERVMLPWKKSTEEGAKAELARAIGVVSDISDQDWTRERLGEILLEAAGDKRGDFLWPLRVALSGAEKSPPPSDIAWVIGKDATLSRIRAALAILT
jgi:glutamyl-tRNA synthetase